jgi:hypothetical protein
LARDNYSFIKHQKELAQKKKREETRQRRLDRKNAKIKDSMEQAPDKDIPIV